MSIRRLSIPLLIEVVVQVAASEDVQPLVDNTHAMPASWRAHRLQHLPLVYAGRIAVQVGGELAIRVAACDIHHVVQDTATVGIVG